MPLVPAPLLATAGDQQTKADFVAAVKAAVPGDDRDSCDRRKLLFGQAKEWLAANLNADTDTVRAELMALVPTAQQEEIYA